MINNFETERDLLNYLMTSEFLDEELTPKELRELLFQFRHFYRASHGKQNALSHQVNKLDKRINLLEKQLSESELESDEKDVKYERVVKRDLSVKERLFGKIIENEHGRKFRLFKK
ncbi:MAG: hypothetical protein SLAVMIC_00447 [uncultured marine phage]|uniref:Uncharacterized protein n=1 Tax=uncultured marine phage TaxID=707152 RepID=A0A8D9FQS8_9VIRU|nr:MAG: hypothetical protein SLAVMIC_00447 [uncultured marine phage]